MTNTQPNPIDPNNKTDRNGNPLVGQILDLIDRDNSRYKVAQGLAAFIEANYTPKTENQTSIMTIPATVSLSRTVIATAAEGSMAKRQAVLDGKVNKPARRFNGDPRDERRCRRCDCLNTDWGAASPLWNAVMRGNDINGPWEFEEIICASCFMELAEERGVATRFRVDVDPRFLKAELKTTTPSGRVWNPETFMWVEPDEPETGDAAA